MILPAEPRHVPAIAALHRDRLTGTLTDLGAGMCRLFYAVVVAEPRGHPCFVDEEAGELVGFAYGAHDFPGAFPTVLRRRPVAFLGLLALGILRRPSLLGRILRQRSESANTGFAPAEAAYLTIRRGVEGGGRALALAGRLFRAFHEAGIDWPEVSIDAANERSLALARNLALEPVGSFHELGVERRRFRIPAERWAQAGEVRP